MRTEPVDHLFVDESVVAELVAGCALQSRLFVTAPPSLLLRVAEIQVAFVDALVATRELVNYVEFECLGGLEQQSDRDCRQQV